MVSGHVGYEVPDKDQPNLGKTEEERVKGPDMGQGSRTENMGEGD